MSFITSNVAGNLLLPVARVGAGNFCACLAGMPVPETAVNKHGQPAAHVSYVRRPGQVRTVEPISRLAYLSAQTPQSKFRSSVLALDGPHCSGALGGRQVVHFGGGVEQRGHDR